MYSLGVPECFPVCLSRREGHLCPFPVSVVGGRRMRLLHRAPPRGLSVRLFCPRELGTLPEAPSPSPLFIFFFLLAPSEGAISFFYVGGISRRAQSPGISLALSDLPKCSSVISELGGISQRHPSFTPLCYEAGAVSLTRPVTSQAPAQQVSSPHHLLRTFWPKPAPHIFAGESQGSRGLSQPETQRL